MMCDYIYIINWEILRSGKVREFTTLNKEEYEEVLKNIRMLHLYTHQLEKTKKEMKLFYMI